MKRPVCALVAALSEASYGDPVVASLQGRHDGPRTARSCRADKMDLSEVEGSVMDTLSQSAAMLGAVWSPAVAIFAALREALKSLASVCEEAPATPTV